MEAVQKEHERLSKRLKASQSIKNVQSTIDILQEARNSIAAGQYNAPVLRSLHQTRLTRPLD